MRRFFKLMTVTMAGVMLMCAVPSAAFAARKDAVPTDAPAQLESGFIDADGVKIEYAVYGIEDGEPLVLLPPNGGNMHWADGSILPGLSQYYRIITVSPSGTGASDRGEGALTFEKQADDLVPVFDALGIDRANVFGFSDGGNLALVFTCRHGDRVKKLAFSGANINPLGTKPIIQLGIVWKFVFLCVKAAFTGKPNDEHDRDIQGMMVWQPNLTFRDIAKITVPVLNIYGEHDMIMRMHSELITRSIPGAQSKMIKGASHSGVFENPDKVMNPLLLGFYGQSAE